MQKRCLKASFCVACLYILLTLLSHISYTHNMETITIVLYTTDTGRQPYVDWFKKLDKRDKSIVLSRLARLRQENFGDCKKINGASIWELRIDYGPGYRVYFGRQDNVVVVLLVGGDKGSQERDIKKAQQYWLDHLENKDG